MIGLTLDMNQYDCPFVDTTDDNERRFRAVNWEYNSTARTLDIRLFAEAPDQPTLNGGLRTLRGHER